MIEVPSNISCQVLVPPHKCGGSMVKVHVLVRPVLVAFSHAGRTHMIFVWTSRVIATFFSYILVAISATTLLSKVNPDCTQLRVRLDGE